MKYRAVIFDLDGVICFTDKYHYQAWKSVADELGIYFDEKINDKLNTSGGTMTGKLVAQSNTDYTVRQVRNIFLSTSEPTAADGQNGDIWFVYDA